MELRPLGRSGLKVSALALGTMNFGYDWHGIGAIDEKTARCLVDLALERGVNLFDTADIYGYGVSEKLLGKILKKRRAKVLLATKVLGQMRPGEPSSGGLSRKHVAEAIDESLARLGTDYVDLYMPHGWDFQVPIDESLEAFERAVKAGKVRALGCSNFSGSQLQDALGRCAVKGWARPEFDQVQYSLAARWIEGDLVDACRASGVGVLAWSPLGGGFLSAKYGGAKRPEGRRKDPSKAFPSLPEERLAGLVGVLKKVAGLEGLSPAATALGWAISKPFVASAVVGARTLAQLEDDLSARPLSARSLAFLDRASSI